MFEPLESDDALISVLVEYLSQKESVIMVRCIRWNSMLNTARVIHCETQNYEPTAAGPTIHYHGGIELPFRILLQYYLCLFLSLILLVLSFIDETKLSHGSLFSVRRGVRIGTSNTNFRS